MDEYTEGYIGETNGEERGGSMGCAIMIVVAIWIVMLAAAPW